MALPGKKSVLVLLLVFCGVSAEAQAAPGAVRWGGPRNRPVPASVGVATQSQLWPRVSGVATVDYYIEPASGDSANLTTAIQTFNTDFKGLIQWVQLDSVGSGSPNYVDINLNSDDTSGECEANDGYEAMQGQPMGGSGSCTVTTLLHEMGHVIGLWHEQQRTDRASYVSVNYAHVIKGSWSNFLPVYEDQQLLTPYDYASVMEYPSWSFSRDGGPVIETIPPGIPLQGADGVPAGTAADYSAGDKEAIGRLYGAAPTAVTVTSNPLGLQVIVDGETVTTPQTYNWALWSTHTLDVPAGVQTLTGDIANSTTTATFYYTYGRWNDSTAQSHTITVTPGNGSPAFPATSPQVATYSANFIQLVPYTAGVYPSAEGTVSVSPQPKTYAGSPDSFFVARQEVTLTATPVSGWHFYEFNNAPYWLPGGLGANPKSFYAPDTGNPVNTTAEFTNTPVYTVSVSPNAFSSNLYAYVDGNFWYVPKNFSHYYDNYSGSDWSAGSSHTISVDSPEYPYSANRRYAFLNWSDAGAQSHSITLPSTSKTYLATLTPEYAPATNFNDSPCGGTAILSPDSPTGDGFYPTGQSLTFTATPDAGWTFAGWTFDLTGTTSPATLTANDETLVFANFNTANTPLTVTLLNPSSTYAGSPAFVMNIRGTGFTAQSLVSVNGNYVTAKYVNSTELQVTVPAALVASPETFQVYVENYPSGWDGCAVFGYDTFTVGSVTAPAITAPAPGSTLAGDSSTFTWTPGVWAKAYTLDLGTTGVGSSNVYAGSSTTETSASVTGIPENGVPLYAELGYQVGPSWRYENYTYTESGSPTPPAMTSPAPNSALSGSTVAFAWSAGAGPIAYKLFVGTTAGSVNIYAGARTTATSATVSGIPTSGLPVYVTLWYELGTTWETIHYTYVEEGGPAMTSPAPGSQVCGSTEEFEWNAGADAAAYQLLVGTSGAGTKNVYSGPVTTGTSETVNGIPQTGATLYVTLKWEVGTVWYAANYTYTECTMPAVTWATPAAITYGTALGSKQLNAKASVPGTFAYTPASGVVLKAGMQTLSVTFTPSDAVDYTTATASVTLNVNQALAPITWPAPAAITYGTPLSATQLDAVSAQVPGTFQYAPPAGGVLKAGTQTLWTTFTPSDTTDYKVRVISTTLVVQQAKPDVTWLTPAAITYGTPLGAGQLDASSGVSGTYSYSPAAGTALTAGTYPLSVTFTPADTTDYTTAAATVTLTVNPNPSNYLLINGWGESITAGKIGGSNADWPDDLAALLQGHYGTPLTVNNYGVSHQDSANICARMGACPVTLSVSSGTIPSCTKTPCPSTAIAWTNTTYQPDYNLRTSPFAGTVAGRAVLVTYSAGGDTISLADPGSALAVSGAQTFSPSVTPAAHTLNVIAAGTSGVFSMAEATRTVADIQAMVNYIAAQGGTSLVISPFDIDNPSWWVGGTNYEFQTYVRQELATLFPQNYLDVEGMLVASYNPALSTDVYAYSKSIKPPSLRTPFDPVGTAAANFGTAAQTSAISSVSISSNIATITANNSFAAGQAGVFSNLTGTGITGMNGPNVGFTILPTGLSSKQFEVSFDNGGSAVNSTAQSQGAQFSVSCPQLTPGTWPVEGFMILIDVRTGEWMSVVDTNGNQPANCYRGYDGTTIAAILAGDTFNGIDGIHLNAQGYQDFAQWVFNWIMAQPQPQPARAGVAFHGNLTQT